MLNNRSYFSDDNDPSFQFGSTIPEDVNLSDIFSEITRRLSTKYEINKGVLLIKSRIDHSLSAVSTWMNGRLRSGLTIKLPSESSLFEKVISQGLIYSENFIETFSGNFFERKLLMDDQSQSFVLQPLKHDGSTVGMVGYSSWEPLTFTMFEEGILSDISEHLAKAIVLRSEEF